MRVSIMYIELNSLIIYFLLRKYYKTNEKKKEITIIKYYL